MNNIREDLIHYIWQTKNFDLSNLNTTSGDDLVIESFGHHNTDAGPDFLHASISINGTIWAGHIEMHINASDWLKHKHGEDPGYQNVILHVVLNADIPIKLSDDTVVPCLELKSRIDHQLISKYQYLQNNKAWIPCESEISTISSIVKETTKNRALAERLSTKSIDLASQLTELDNNLNELIYRRMAWAFGLKVNADAMLTLARSLPYQVILKHRDHLIQVEALLFGQSGLIDSDDNHPYVHDLKREYKVLKKKFGLRPMQAVQWKYSRLRPPAFPTIRLAQFAKFLHQTSHLDALFFSSEHPHIAKAMNVTLDGYWEEHYRFGQSSPRRIKHLGDKTKEIIVINGIVPVLFMYGTIRQIDRYKDLAITLLEKIAPELNSITKRWATLGMINESAADSQALLELKKNHCDRQQCMRCPIGHKIIASHI